MYVNEVFSPLLDLCCLSLSTCEKKLLLLLYTYGYVVYNSSSQKPATIGVTPLVIGLERIKIVLA